MGDHERGAVLEQLVQRGLYELLEDRIEVGGRFVEDQDPRVLEREGLYANLDQRQFRTTAEVDEIVAS